MTTASGPSSDTRSLNNDCLEAATPFGASDASSEARDSRRLLSLRHPQGSSNTLCSAGFTLTHVSEGHSFVLNPRSVRRIRFYVFGRLAAFGIERQRVADVGLPAATS
jgi:hypothetical protein